MALQDILDAIAHEADDTIAAAQEQHAKKMQQMREAHEQVIAKKRAQIHEQKEQKKRQMKEKAESHARMLKSKLILAKKQELIDRLYGDVLTALASLPSDRAQTFLAEALKQVRATSGEIQPASAHAQSIKKLLPEGMSLGEPLDATGGFRFVSDEQEQNFTFEFLVQNLLRPLTEVKTARKLFPAHS